MSSYEARKTYRKWWVGKMCRVPLHENDFKKVVDVEVVGPPSFVYGDAYLIFEDGSRVPVFHGRAFKPRKCDVEIKEAL